MKPKTETTTDEILESLLEKRCLWFRISRRQRLVETLRGDGLEGTEHYKTRGCYICSGYNTHCEDYTEPKRRVKEDDCKSIR